MNQVAVKKRKWTEEEPEGNFKWVGIAILAPLFAIGTAFFVYWIIPRRAPQVHVSQLILEDLEGAFAKPLFGARFVDVSDAAQDWRLDEYKPTADATGREIHSYLNSLPQKLSGQGFKSQDTAIIYLRGHAVQVGEKLLVLQSEVRSDSDLEELAVSSETILGKLAQLEATNVVLIADFCDLATAPTLGVAFNDFLQPLQRELAKAGREHVWVLTSAAPGQPGHSSWKSQHTLLQSAMKYALQKPGDRVLDLATFYSNILRYADRVTNGTQTPLLLNQGNQFESTESPLWTRASTVQIDKRDRAVQEADDEQRSSGPEKQTEIATSQSTEDESVPDSPKDLDRVETDPWWRFWQLHDQLLARDVLSTSLRTDGDGGWSPVDFAPGEWQEIQRQGSKATRLHFATQDSQSIVELEQLVRQLEQLSRAMARNEISTQEGTLLQAWRELRQELNQDGKSAWETSSHLAAELEMGEAGWRSKRGRLRELSDAIGKLPGCLEYCSGRVDRDIRSRLSEVSNNGLLDQIRDAQSRDEILNANATSIITDYPVEKIVAAARRIAQRDLNSQLLDWAELELIQHLICNPIVPFDVRKQLATFHANLELSQVMGPNHVVIDGRKDLANILEDSTSSVGYFEELFGLWESHHDLVVRGQGLFAPTPNERLARVSLDSGLEVKYAAKHYLPERLELTVAKRNGGSLDAVFLEWKTDQDSSAIHIRHGSKLLRPNTRTELPVEARSLKLAFEDISKNSQSSSAFEKFFADRSSQELQLRISTQGGQQVEMSVQLFPPRPNRVELLAELQGNLIPGLQRRFTPTHAPDFDLLPQANQIIHGMGVPAIDGATKTFRFFVHNRSKEAKTVRVDFFPVVGARPLGNGKVTLADAKNTSISDNSEPLFGAGLYDLQPEEIKEVVLQPSATQPDNATKALQFGLVCRIAEGFRDAAADNVFVQDTQRTRLTWIDVVAENPVKQRDANDQDISIIQVDPEVRSDSLRFTFQARPEIWDALGLQKVPLMAELTDASGRPAGILEAPKELSPDEPKQTLTLIPSEDWMDQRSGKLVAHITVGDYPRAIAFESSLLSKDDIFEANRAFLWLAADEANLRDNSGAKVESQFKTRDQITLPAVQGVDALQPGNPVRIANVEIPMKVDFPRYGEQSVSIRSASTDRFTFDRAFSPRLQIDGQGRLSLSGSVDDLTYRIAGPLTYSQTVSVQVSRGGLRQQEIEVRVDKQPPEIREIRLTGGGANHRIGVMDTLEVSATIVDDTKVKDVFFALDIRNLNQQFDSEDFSELGARGLPNGSGNWVWMIKGEQLKEKLVKGSYRIVCRAIDVAGNKVDRSTKVPQFYWRGP